MKSWEIEQELKESGIKEGRADLLAELVRDGVLTEEEAFSRAGIEGELIRDRIRQMRD